MFGALEELKHELKVLIFKNDEDEENLREIKGKEIKSFAKNLFI